MALNKKVLIHTGAGIAAVILLAFGITQCSQKRSEREANDSAMRKIESNRQEMQAANETLKRATCVLDSLMDANLIQADSIIVLNDSIAVLNDSLDLVQGQLDDCRKGKRNPTPTRPTPTRPTPVKPTNPHNGNRTRIDMRDNSINNEQIVVQNDGGNGNDTEITLGNGTTNNGQIVVNNGGTVTISSNQAAIDSLRNAVDSLQMKNGNSFAGSSVVVIKKVKTYTRTR